MIEGNKDPPATSFRELPAFDSCALDNLVDRGNGAVSSGNWFSGVWTNMDCDNVHNQSPIRSGHHCPYTHQTRAYGPHCKQLM